MIPESNAYMQKGKNGHLIYTDLNVSMNEILERKYTNKNFENVG